MPSVQSWKQLMETNEYGGKSAAGNYEGNFHENRHFTEHRYTREGGFTRLHNAKYDGRSECIAVIA